MCLYFFSSVSERVPDLAAEALEREHGAAGGHGRVRGEQGEGKLDGRNPQQRKGKTYFLNKNLGHFVLISLFNTNNA
jgi:hypothetical protein